MVTESQKGVGRDARLAPVRVEPVKGMLPQTEGIGTSVRAQPCRGGTPFPYIRKKGVDAGADAFRGKREKVKGGS